MLSGIPFWGQTLYTEARDRAKRGCLSKGERVSRKPPSLQHPGKLKNFKYDAAEITGYRTTFAKLKEIENLESFAHEIGPAHPISRDGGDVLPEDHPWVAESKKSRAEFLTEIRKPAQRESEAFKAEVVKRLKKLKADYIKAYLDLYRKARLSISQDKEKNALLQDYRLKNLRRLATLEINQPSATQRIRSSA